MHILLLLTAGLIPVIGGVVFPRLPAFAARNPGAIPVAWLTPREMLFDAFISQQAAQVGSVNGDVAELSRAHVSADGVPVVAPQLTDNPESVDRGTICR